MKIINFNGNSIIGLSVLAFALGVTACGGESGSANTNTTPANAPGNRAAVQPMPSASPSPSDDSDEAFLRRMRESNARGANSGKINKTNFEKIANGMKLSDVEKLLGEKGNRTGMNNKNGVISEFYKWNVLGENVWIEVTVKDGEVIGKASENLR